MSLAKNFGAAGDGTTDDTDALQHAVDDGDGVLELSKGTYRITRPVVLHGNSVSVGAQGDIQGDGPATRIDGNHMI
jgi:hypothetical protein